MISRVLALDGAGRELSVALTGVGVEVAPGFRQAEHLPVMVERLMGGASFSTLDYIAVTLGPGSYTGLRTTLAFARGLALACAAKLVAVTSLELWARGVAMLRRGDEAEVLIVLDLRRADYAMQRFAFTDDGGVQAISDPLACAPEQIAAYVMERGILLAGDGAAVAITERITSGGGLARLIEPRQEALAATFAVFAAGLPVCRAEMLRPLYLRPPTTASIATSS